MEGGATAEIHPGTYSLNEVQQALATKKLALESLSLEPFRSPLALESLGIKMPENKRLTGVHEAQSNEPFRPFMELLLNSIDYNTAEKPHLKISVAKMEKEHGGWQIVISDEPHGAGMNTDTLINTYFDPYASGSAANRMTARGEWKKGLMGVGAQQQVSLLRHEGDEIYISAAQKSTISLAHLQIETGDVAVTLGGVGKDTSTIDRVGVSQVIRLTEQTCNEIEFTPENFAAYISERLGCLEGTLIDMDVVQPRNRQDDTFSLSQANASEALRTSLAAKWEVLKQQRTVTQGETQKEKVSYRLVSPQPLEEQNTNNGAMKILFSKEKAQQSFVYLNVLGVRVGDPILVAGNNLPQTVDLRFERPVETITEGRNATGLSEQEALDLVDSIQSIKQSSFADSSSENNEIKLSLLTALTPLYERYDKNNRFRSKNKMNITGALGDCFSQTISKALYDDMVVLPDSYRKIVAIPSPNYLFVPDTYINAFDIERSVEHGEFTPVLQFSPPVFLAEFVGEEPVWVSPEGQVLINKKKFPEINQETSITIQAIIVNRGQWKGEMLTTHLSNEVSVDELQELDDQSEYTESRGFGNSESLQHIREESKQYFESLQREWNGLSLAEKKDRIQGWINIMYIYNTELVISPRHPSVTSLDQNRFFTIINGSYDDPSDKNTNWWTFDESSLDNWMKMIASGLEHGVIEYAPSGILQGNDLMTNLLFFSPQVPLDETMVLQWEKVLASEDADNTLQFLHTLELNVSPETFQLYTKYNASFHDNGKVISEHAEEFVNMLTGTPEEKQACLEFWSDSQRVQRVNEYVIAATEKRLAYEHLAYANPLFLYPEQGPFLERIIQESDQNYLSEAFFESYGMAMTNPVPFFDPKTFLEIIIPFADRVGWGSHDILLFTENRDQLEWATNKQQQLQQILEGNFSLSREESLPVIDASFASFDPAILALLQASGETGSFFAAENAQLFLTNAERAFLPEKRQVRKRELLHPILHLNQTPGSSYFELVKNSWGAISRERSANKQDRTIEISDFFVPGEESSYYGFSIQDFVGMHPREALFKLIVPGVGEGVHGLHFLQLLKDVDFVEITTVRDGKAGTIFLQSIKDAQGNVTDFSTHYKEFNDASLRSTKIRAFKTVHPLQVAIESVGFRENMKDFAKNIPRNRAEIRLNATVLNTDDLAYFEQQVPEFGNCRIKPNAKETLSVAIDKIPLRSFDLSSLLASSSLSPFVKEILSTTGFALDIVDTPLRLTRDDTGFIDQQAANEQIVALVEGNYQYVLSAMLKTGNLDFQKVFPAEVWKDPYYSQSLLEKYSSVDDSIDWNEKNSVRKWLLTLPIFIAEDKNMSLAQIINAYAVAARSNMVIPFYPNDTVPETLKRLLFKTYQALRTVSPEKEELEEGLALPSDIAPYLLEQTTKAEEAVWKGQPLPIKAEISMYRGRDRGMRTQARYSPKSDSYSWHDNMTSRIRNAINGDPNSRALVRETTVHEAQHRKAKTDEDFFSHDENFYEAVEASLMRMT